MSNGFVLFLVFVFCFLVCFLFCLLFSFLLRSRNCGTDLWKVACLGIIPHETRKTPAFDRETTLEALVQKIAHSLLVLEEVQAHHDIVDVHRAWGSAGADHILEFTPRIAVGFDCRRRRTM